MTSFKRFLVLFFLILLLFTSIYPSAHTAVWLSVSYDPLSLTYDAEVDDPSEKHKEIDVYNLKGFANFNPSSNSYTKGWVQAKNKYIELKNKDGVSSNDYKSFYNTYVGCKYPDGLWENLTNNNFVGGPFILTFPAVHRTSANPFGRYAESNDAVEAMNDARAQRVVDTALEDLNNCLQFVMDFAYPDGCTSNECQILAVELAARSEQVFKKQNPDPLTIGTVEVTFGKAEDGRYGLGPEYCMKVNVAGVSQEFCFACPKGYVPRPYDLGWVRTDNRIDGKFYDPLYKHGDIKGGGDIGREPIKDLIEKNDVLFINWSILIASANYSYDVSGAKQSDLVVAEDGGPLAELIGKFFKWAINSIKRELKLEDIEDYILIQGDMDRKYVYGIFPYAWVQASLILYAVSLAAAVSLIGFSVLKIIWKQQLSTINIGEKIALQEDLKNLIITLFLFFAFIPIFIFLAGLNVTLVRLFSSAIVDSSGSTNPDILYNSPAWHMPNPTYDSFGSIVLAIAELILTIYFNAFYIVRGATIAALIGVAPLAIYSLSLGGKYTGVFTAYFKELISQIFSQSIHALMLAFFFNSIRYQNLSSFQMLVVLYAMIPVTKFIKTKVFQLSEGPAGQVGLTATKTATGLASGAIKGATSFNPGRSSGKNDGERGRGGSGGSSNGDGLLSSAIDRNATTERKHPGHLDMTDSRGHENRDTKEGSVSGHSKDKPAPNYIRDADREVGGKFVKGLGGAALTAAKSGLYVGAAVANAGMGVGMGMLGEDPSKYMEQAGANLGKAAHTQGLALKQTYDASSNLLKYSLAKDGGRHQYIREAEDAGIIGIRRTGGAMTYGINYRNANDHHKSVYEDIKKAYTADSDGKFTKQQEAAQKHYRDNYGITQVRMDSVNGKKMQIDLDSAAMEAHRMSDTNPFAGMKTFNWREEKDS